MTPCSSIINRKKTYLQVEKDFKKPWRLKMNIQKKFFVIFLGSAFLLTGYLFPLPGRAAEPAPNTVIIPLFRSNQAPVTSFLSIPFTAFVGPYGGLGALLNTGACWVNNGTMLVYLQAPIILPHGAVVKEITVNYYIYYAGDSRAVQLLRMNKDGASAIMAQVNCSDQQAGHALTATITNPAIDNENYTYYLYALGFNCGRKHAIRWVGIKYEK